MATRDAASSIVMDGDATTSTWPEVQVEPDGVHRLAATIPNMFTGNRD